jgi:molecular chaperone HscB
MNYFELFEIPVQLRVNTSELSQKFFALSRKYHPDFFIGEPEDVQVEMLEKSSLLNRAWKTFKDPDATLRYVLQLNGLVEEEEKYTLPPDFLMEVMDLNEQLMDAEDIASKKDILPALSRLQEEIYEPVKDIIENQAGDTVPEADLLKVKAYYFKKKYLDRMREQLGGMA